MTIISSRKRRKPIKSHKPKFAVRKNSKKRRSRERMKNLIKREYKRLENLAKKRTSKKSRRKAKKLADFVSGKKVQGISKNLPLDLRRKMGHLATTPGQANLDLGMLFAPPGERQKYSRLRKKASSKIRRTLRNARDYRRILRIPRPFKDWGDVEDRVLGDEDQPMAPEDQLYLGREGRYDTEEGPFEIYKDACNRLRELDWSEAERRKGQMFIAYHLTRTWLLLQEDNMNYHKNYGHALEQLYGMVMFKKAKGRILTAYRNYISANQVEGVPVFAKKAWGTRRRGGGEAYPRLKIFQRDSKHDVYSQAFHELKLNDWPNKKTALYRGERSVYGESVYWRQHEEPTGPFVAKYLRGFETDFKNSTNVILSPGRNRAVRKYILDTIGWKRGDNQWHYIIRVSGHPSKLEKLMTNATSSVGESKFVPIVIKRGSRIFPPGHISILNLPATLVICSAAFYRDLREHWYQNSTYSWGSRAYDDNHRPGELTTSPELLEMLPGLPTDANGDIDFLDDLFWPTNKSEFIKCMTRMGCSAIQPALWWNESLYDKW